MTSDIRYEHTSKEDLIALLDAEKEKAKKSRRFSRHFHEELERVEMRAKTLMRDLDVIPFVEVTERLEEIVAICQATVDYN